MMLIKFLIKILYVRLKRQPENITLIKVYAPIADADEEEIEGFYEQLDNVKQQCKGQDFIIVMGYFNTKVGGQRLENITGDYGLGVKNKHRERLIEWCKRNNQVIKNTWFQQHVKRLLTWKSPG